MIGQLTGLLVSKHPPEVLVDVHGVGYELSVPMSTLYQLPEVGQRVTLLTHFYVREDHQTLYGFAESNERSLFRALIKISGVGPKMALTILSGMEVRHFMQCVDQRDPSALVKLPGVGRKTAERLIVEMAGKLAVSRGDDVAKEWFTQLVNEAFLPPIQQEAYDALVRLGYKSTEARKLIEGIEGQTSAEVIRLALQRVVS